MSETATFAGAGPEQICGTLWSIMGLGPSDRAGSVVITGADPIVPSVHRVGAATAGVLAAAGAAVAAIWKLRQGEEQDVSVDVRRAVVPGLQTIGHLYQNGYRIPPHPRGTDYPGFFRTADGRIIFLLRSFIYPEILLRLMNVLDCGYEAASFARAAARWHSQELEDALARRKAVGVIARTRQEWRDHPQGRWLAARPAVHIEQIGESAPEPFQRAPRPLAGVRVLDFTHVLAGPTTSKLLAEHGADVLHVCAPWRQDPHAMHLDTGWGKRCALIDLEQAGEEHKLRSLLGGADLFVQSWRPGAMERTGLGPQEVAKLRPGIVYVSVSCYGYGGPWRERGGFEPIGQTACGLAIDEGSAAAPKLAPTGTVNDYLTAYLAAAGALAALVRRAREGGSYHVQVSLTRTSMFLQELGTLTEAQRARMPAAVPTPQSPSFVTMDSQYGRLRAPGPLIGLSKTPPHWDRPPSPPGQHGLVWSD